MFLTKIRSLLSDLILSSGSKKTKRTNQTPSRGSNHVPGGALDLSRPRAAVSGTGEQEHACLAKIKVNGVIAIAAAASQPRPPRTS